jgi:hypothetical protein
VSMGLTDVAVSTFRRASVTSFLPNTPALCGLGTQVYKSLELEERGK